MKTVLALLILANTGFLLAAQIRFAPLPVLGAGAQSKIYLPVVQHLQRQSNHVITMQRFDTYDAIIKSFAAGNTDLAVLGPLPARKLLQRYDNAAVLGKYRGESGQGRYRCVLATSIQRGFSLAKRACGTDPAAVNLWILQCQDPAAALL